jgi:hypothetical protein
MGRTGAEYIFYVVVSGATPREVRVFDVVDGGAYSH